MITHLVAASAIAEEEVWLDGEAYHHLIRVRRLSIGSQVRLVDGSERSRWGTLEQIEKKCARLVLGDDAPSFEPPHQLHLLVASLRRERASWLVEKATELGAFGISFLHTERAPRSFGENQMKRFRRVAIAALEQSHRTRLPVIDGVHPWSTLESLLAPYPLRFYLRPGADSPLSSQNLTQEPSRAVILIGPEGGWTSQEMQELEDRACLPGHLGGRILRIETAAITSLARLLADEV